MEVSDRGTSFTSDCPLVERDDREKNMVSDSYYYFSLIYIVY